jgi:hypothetical protein
MLRASDCFNGRSNLKRLTCHESDIRCGNITALVEEEKKTVKINDTIVAAVSLIVVMIAMLSTIGIVVDQVNTASAAAVNWTFTGHAGAAALLGLIPFAWIAGIAVMGIAGSFLLVQGLKGGKKGD